MNNNDRFLPARHRPAKGSGRRPRWLLPGLLLLGVIVLAGCLGSHKTAHNKEFFTSGSREADQRASQRMAQAEQITGSGEGAAERGVKKSSPSQSGASDMGTNAARGGLNVQGKEALFDRLGGEVGISNIVADFSPRVLNDPRVNWEREGVTRGGFSFHRGQSVTWKATPENIEKLKKHFVQFLALATGGPPQYDGKDMKSTHAALHIANAEFDAALGDLKATLDKLQIPNREQKELLAIFESTRTEIVVER